MQDAFEPEATSDITRTSERREDGHRTLQGNGRETGERIPTLGTNATAQYGEGEARWEYGVLPDL